MTPKQTQFYWSEWAAVRRVCLAKGWAVPERHELHVKALGKEKSSKDFSNGDFDRVLQVFRSFSRPDSVNAGLRQERMPRSRLEHKIKIELMRLLAVCLGSARDGQAERPAAAEVEPDFEAAHGYLVEVMGKHGTDDLGQVSDVPVVRFAKDRRGRVVLREGEPVVSCEKSDLELVRDTMAARINGLRNKRGGAERGWSIHDLKVAAGVACDCATHCRGAAAQVVEDEQVMEEKV